MPDYHFVFNLKPYTFDERYRKHLKPWGYLLAPNNATRSFRKLATNVVKDGKYAFFADNGNFTIVGKIKEKYLSKAKLIFEKIKKEELKIKFPFLPSNIPEFIQKLYRVLASQIIKIVQNIVPTDKEILSSQLGLNPTHLIGVENITLATWLCLNIEPEYLKYPAKFYRGFNKAVAVRAVKQIKELEKLYRGKYNYYPVASALSHRIALDAGKEFAARGCARVAMGFGAFMADDNYSDFLELNNKIIKLSTSMPNRYLRTVAVAKGFWQGYKRTANKAPSAFHFLGLGAPIMIPLVALCAWGTKELTFDATSPIKDAIEGTLYLNKPAYLKSKSRRLALRIARGDIEKWDCACYFCKEFTRKHPFDYKKGKKWFSARPKSSDEEISAKDLQPGSPLFEAYPLLSEPRGGQLRKEVDFARIGHNHWIISQIMADLSRHSQSRAKLKDFVENIVNNYSKNTNSVKFGEAIKYAFHLASEN
ncbi:hypothetical protein HZB05_01580 [Candidatus Wolfebacteria bacterium]|nr:hypothetical protein [Candidatus Wolfebacteria bacterium]